MKALHITTLAAALFTSAVAAPAAMADTVTIEEPLAGETLHAGDIAMSLYYTETTSDKLAVVATYMSDAGSDHPSRVISELADGDSVHFTLPGHPGTVQEFARIAHTVTVSSEATAQYMADTSTWPTISDDKTLNAYLADADFDRQNQLPIFKTLATIAGPADLAG